MMLATAFRDPLWRRSSGRDRVHDGGIDGDRDRVHDGGHNLTGQISTT